MTSLNLVEEFKSDISGLSSPNSWKNPSQHLSCLLEQPWYSHIAALTSGVLTATHHFFESRNIQPFLFPITTGAISSPMGKGSDSEPVQVTINDNKVYLADSMQFCLELGARLNPAGAYYVMPTFRGELTDSRHLNEFVHSEVEIPGQLADIQSLAEAYVRAIIRSLADNQLAAIEAIAGTTKHLEDFFANRPAAFPRIRYQDALVELKHVSGALTKIEDCAWPAISGKGEKELLRIYGDFIWLTHMPWSNVPFYQAKENDTEFSMTGDMLAGIGEILGCGQRVASVTDLKESLDYHEVDENSYDWYKEMRVLKPVQTAGFGLGIERLLLWMTQSHDIRNMTLLLRDHRYILAP